MAIVLGLLVALFYGCGDFFGGVAAKRTPAVTVVLGSFALSAALVAATTAGWYLVGTPPSPAAPDLWLGVAVGLIGPAAVGLLYRGLAMGRMSVVAPITAVVAAIVPLVWALLDGERPSAIALVGVAIALLSIVLVAGAPEHDDHPDDGASAPIAQVVPPAVASGLGFGAVFVLLGQTSSDAGLWPLLVARPVAVVLTALGALVLVRRAGDPARAIIPARVAWPAVAGAGVLDIAANAIYLAATKAGLLSIVAVLSSLYPAATVVLARIVLGERLHRAQVIGLALAAGGIAAMAAG
ncbi:EamA family transporter [Aquihabitans daechungensis]|uniref:EamA family transporter n=1 Tax=Aquihabitans daechungensis TaxID=1052257 RepID=UPI003B9FCA35